MIEFFTDPVLAAPTIGSMLMSLVAAFVGTFAVLKKQSLIGETLSHACYPGVIIALIVTKLYFPSDNDALALFVPMIGAGFSCVLGMYLVQLLTDRFKIAGDSALCFVLASFFGVALVLLTALQGIFPTLYKELQGYLFGQAATQTTIHIVIYAILALLILCSVLLYYRPIKAVLFDSIYAKTIGIDCEKINFLLLAITVLAVVIGIRSLGVVLLSAMLIFPAISCRLWTAKLELLLVLSAIFGLLSGFFGIYFSHRLSLFYTHDNQFVSFPTGPMIVLMASLLFLFSVLFAPQKGLLFRILRRWKFRRLCQQENVLKAIWKFCSKSNTPSFSANDLSTVFYATPGRLFGLLSALEKKGWIQKIGQKWELTALGMLWGRKIVRLHRLWEVYLVQYCGVGKDRVHPSAEEMEHIITPEIEHEIELILHNPHQDPHHQPIPSNERDLLKP